MFSALRRSKSRRSPECSGGSWLAVTCHQLSLTAISNVFGSHVRYCQLKTDPVLRGMPALVAVLKGWNQNVRHTLQRPRKNRIWDMSVVYKSHLTATASLTATWSLPSAYCVSQVVNVSWKKVAIFNLSPTFASFKNIDTFCTWRICCLALFEKRCFIWDTNCSFAAALVQALHVAFIQTSRVPLPNQMAFSYIYSVHAESQMLSFSCPSRHV